VAASLARVNRTIYFLPNVDNQRGFEITQLFFNAFYEMV